MSFFKRIFKSQRKRTGIVFIVEDDVTYAKTLESYIRLHFPLLSEIKLFPVGETCLMELKKMPDLIIMDYFLDSKYYDAETGTQIIKQIRQQQADTNIVVLSSQQNIDVVVEAIEELNCEYVVKNEQAFEKIKEIITYVYQN